MHVISVYILIRQTRTGVSALVHITTLRNIQNINLKKPLGRIDYYVKSAIFMQLIFISTILLQLTIFIKNGLNLICMKFDQGCVET